MRIARVALLIAVAAGCGSPAAPEDFEIGMSKQQLRERFGEPVATTEMVKNTEYIFGPVETFWSTMAMGDRLEIWSYPSPGGHVELYFVNGADAVSGQGFNDENAVY